MGVTKSEVEELLGQRIPDDQFEEALNYAKRKQEYSYNREKNPAIMENWYLAELTKEYVCSLAFSRFTMDLCRTLRNMEKEHSAKSQSAQTHNYIVTVLDL